MLHEDVSFEARQSCTLLSSVVTLRGVASSRTATAAGGGGGVLHFAVWNAAAWPSS